MNVNRFWKFQRILGTRIGDTKVISIGLDIAQRQLSTLLDHLKKVIKIIPPKNQQQLSVEEKIKKFNIRHLDCQSTLAFRYQESQ